MTRIFACFSKSEDADFGDNPLNATINAALAMIKGQKYVDIFFVGEDCVTYFMARPGRQFEKFSKKIGIKNNKWSEQYLPYIYLELKMNEEEEHKLLRTCETFSGLNIPYNLKDCLIYNAALLWNPDEIDLFSVKKLADVQAVILILRECLVPTHPIVDAVKGLNSRTCTVDILYDALIPVTTRITYDPLLKPPTQAESVVGFSPPSGNGH
jgi:hypothetical protein